MTEHPHHLDLERQARAAAAVTAAIAAVTDWDAATPCTEWTARDLLAHVVTEQAWIPGLLAGGTMDEVAEDLHWRLRAIDEADGPHLARDWAETVDGVAAAWRGTPADERVHLSYGAASVAHYLRQQTSDLAVHSWDLARSQGADVPWGEDLAAAVLAQFHDDPGHEIAPHLFAPPTAERDSDDARRAALALSGRDPEWAPPHPRG